VVRDGSGVALVPIAWMADLATEAAKKREAEGILADLPKRYSARRVRA
jgi:hypothetical protein